MTDLKSQACESFQHADCDQRDCQCDCHGEVELQKIEAESEALRQSSAEKQKIKCDICGEPCSYTNICEICGKAFGPCCNSMRDAICVCCTDGGSDE